MAGNKESGRKTNRDEIAAMVLALAAIGTEFKSELEFWQFCAKKARDSNFHLQKLIEYAYGKPKETVEKTVIKKHVVDLPEK